MLTGKLYRWVYFTGTDGVRRVIRQHLDEQAAVTSQQVYTYPSPPGPDYTRRHPVALVGSMLITADYTTNHSHLQLTRIDLDTGVETPIDTPFGQAPAFHNTMVTRGQNGPRSLACQSDWNTLLLVVEDAYFIIDLESYALVDYGSYWHENVIVKGDKGLYLLVAGMNGNAVIDGVTRYWFTKNIHGPVDPRNIPSNALQWYSLPQIGTFGYEYDELGHYTVDGMTNAVGLVADDTVEWTSFCGFMRGAQALQFGAVSRFYGRSTLGLAVADLAPHTFIDCEAVEVPALTAAAGAYTVGAAWEDYQPTFDWRTIIAAEGLDYVYTDSDVPYGSGTMYYTPPIEPFWTRTVHTVEVVG